MEKIIDVVFCWHFCSCNFFRPTCSDPALFLQASTTENAERWQALYFWIISCFLMMLLTLLMPFWTESKVSQVSVFWDCPCCSAFPSQKSSFYVHPSFLKQMAHLLLYFLLWIFWVIHALIPLHLLLFFPFRSHANYDAVCCFCSLYAVISIFSIIFLECYTLDWSCTPATCFFRTARTFQFV